MGAEAMRCTFHLLPIGYLVAVLPLLGNLPVWIYWGAGALLLLISPFGAIILLPFLALACFFAWRRQGGSLHSWAPPGVLTFKMLVAVSIAAIAFLYYQRGEGVVLVAPVTRFLATPTQWVIFLLSLFLAVAWLFYIPWRYRCERRWLLATTAVLFLTAPWLFIGSSGNEFFMKATPLLLFITSLFWGDSLLSHPDAARRDVLVWLMIALCAAKVGGTLLSRGRDAALHWNDRAFNVFDPFQGHLYHPGKAIDQGLPGTVPPLVPGLFYTRAGESEQGLLRGLATPPCDKYEKKHYVPARAFPLDRPFPIAREISPGIEG